MQAEVLSLLFCWFDRPADSSGSDSAATWDVTMVYVATSTSIKSSKGNLLIQDFFFFFIFDGNSWKVDLKPDHYYLVNALRSRKMPLFIRTFGKNNNDKWVTARSPQPFHLQDAQEFSKLFLSLLEDTLSKQKNANLQNVIQQQFCGQFSYVTV